MNLHRTATDREIFRERSAPSIVTNQRTLCDPADGVGQAVPWFVVVNQNFALVRFINLRRTI